MPRRSGASSTSSWRHRRRSGDSSASILAASARRRAGAAPPSGSPPPGTVTAEGSLTFAPPPGPSPLGLDLADVTSPALAVPAARRRLADPQARRRSRTWRSISADPVRAARAACTSPAAVPLSAARTGKSSPRRADRAHPGDRRRPGRRPRGGAVPRAAGSRRRRSLGGRSPAASPSPARPNALTGRVDAVAPSSVVRLCPGKASAPARFEGAAVRVERGEVELPAGIAAPGASIRRRRVLPVARRPRPGARRRAVPGCLGRARRYGGRRRHRLRHPRPAAGDGHRPRPGPRPRGASPRPARGDGRRRHLGRRTVEVQGSLPGLASPPGGGRLDRRGADLALDLTSDNLGPLARAAAGGRSPTSPARSWAPSPSPPTSPPAPSAPRSPSRPPPPVPGAGDLQRRAGRGGARRRLVTPLALPPRAGTTPSCSSTAPPASPPPASARPALPEHGRGPWAELFLPRTTGRRCRRRPGAVRGTVAEPELNGEGEIRGGRLIVPASRRPSTTSPASSFNRDRISIEGCSPAGAARPAGSRQPPPAAAGRRSPHQVHVTAQDVSARFPEFLINRGNADLSLISNGSGGGSRAWSTSSASLYVEDIKVDLVELLQRLFQRQRVSSPRPTIPATTQLDITVAGPDALRVRNNLADLPGDVDLTVRGSVARPVVFGKVTSIPAASWSTPTTSTRWSAASSPSTTPTRSIR